MHTWSFAQTKLVSFPDQAPKKSELSWLQYTNIRTVEAFAYQKELRGTKGLGSKTTFKYPESVIKQAVCETYDARRRNTLLFKRAVRPHCQMYKQGNAIIQCENEASSAL